MKTAARTTPMGEASPVKQAEEMYWLMRHHDLTPTDIRRAADTIRRLAFEIQDRDRELRSLRGLARAS